LDSSTADGGSQRKTNTAWGYVEGVAFTLHLAGKSTAYDNHPSLGLKKDSHPILEWMLSKICPKLRLSILAPIEKPGSETFELHFVRSF
jgi:hypothetical protein